ncbi:MAG: hypothetical protein JW803_07460 [Endomicrobiales bacterium]|nr:hypothetical protein [Endomicrobiales bacterium]
MRRIIALSLITAVFAGCYSTSAVRKIEPSGIAAGEKLLVAVVEFKNQTGDAENDGLIGSVTGIMVDELVATEAFRLIERQRLDDVLGELKLNMSGLVDAENAKSVGKQLGVDAFLFGDLTSVKYSRSKQTIFIMWTEGQRADVTLDARLVDVETGEIIKSAKATSFVKQRNWVAFWFAKLGGMREKGSVVQTGIELCVKQLASDLSQVSK